MDHPAHDTAEQQQAQVRIQRHYPVAPQKVWRAWTEPQALLSWFTHGSPAAEDSADVDLRVGGRFRVAFTLPDKGQSEASGDYQQVQPHEHLAFSWRWRSTPERVSRIRIHLAQASGGGTDMLFVHDRFFDDAARANHQQGWQRILAHLDGYLLQDTQDTTTAL